MHAYMEIKILNHFSSHLAAVVHSTFFLTRHRRHEATSCDLKAILHYTCFTRSGEANL